MAIGDQADMVGRINSTLPPWFGDSNPVLNSIVNGIAAGLVFIYTLYQFAVMQSRIATSTGSYVDIVSADFFGTSLPRAVGESDASFIARIQANFLKERATRASISNAIAAITGSVPAIVEPMRPADTLSWSNPGMGYGMTGAYGSMLFHHQAFVTIYDYAGAPAPIYAAIEANRAAGTIVWTRMTSAVKPPFVQIGSTYIVGQSQIF